MVLKAKCFDEYWKKYIFDCELVEWPLICRDLYQHRWMGGPDATSDLWKQPFSAVRASGGYPGNAKQLWNTNLVWGISRTWTVHFQHFLRQLTVVCLCTSVCLGVLNMCFVLTKTLLINHIEIYLIHHQMVPYISILHILMADTFTWP